VDDNFEVNELQESKRVNKFEQPQRSHRVPSNPKIDYLKQVKIE
jgi:hypothetical protein